MTAMKAGRPAAAEAAAVLTVLDAVLCTAQEFPGELAGHYPGACAALGLAVRERGYALLLAQDRDGARWTVVSTDVSVVAATLAVREMGVEAGFDPEPRSVDRVLPGWPLACALALPDRPAPRDPHTTGRVLRAAPNRWAPTLRRAFADRLARELLEPADEPSREMELLDMGRDPGDQRPRIGDLLAREPSDQHQAEVDAALEEVRALARDGAPLGAIRAVRALGKVSLVRAGAERWSLLARPAAGSVVLLLDAAPMRRVDLAPSEGVEALLETLRAAAP